MSPCVISSNGTNSVGMKYAAPIPTSTKPSPHGSRLADGSNSTSVYPPKIRPALIRPARMVVSVGRSRRGVNHAGELAISARASHMLLRMTASPKGKSVIAARAWQLLFDFFASTRPERDRTLERRNLTPNDSRALMTLDVQAGKTMGTLAREWCCDASNATWVVDRLERLGFAVRRPNPTDRRVKLVVLTPKGAKAKSEILEEFRTPPAGFLALERRDLDALATILQKVQQPPSSAGIRPKSKPPQSRRGKTAR
jgi:DNA-binding MarR family transcriptional regulator